MGPYLIYRLAPSIRHRHFFFIGRRMKPFKRVDRALRQNNRFPRYTQRLFRAFFNGAARRHGYFNRDTTSYIVYYAKRNQVDFRFARFSPALVYATQVPTARGISSYNYIIAEFSVPVKESRAIHLQFLFSSEVQCSLSK